MRRGRRIAATLGATAVFVVGGATAAQAYTATALSQGAASANLYAYTNHFSMSPMTDAGIKSSLVTWCDTYAKARGAGKDVFTARSLATTNVSYTIGTQKATAIRAGSSKVCAN